MKPGTPEFDLIKQYIDETSDGAHKRWKQFNIFKIERKGEGEKYDKY
jgi:hypothetical protein